eukprot:6181090-Pleurochrysis_carterae.AAC.2
MVEAANVWTDTHMGECGMYTSYRSTAGMNGIEYVSFGRSVVLGWYWRCFSDKHDHGRQG